MNFGSVLMVSGIMLQGREDHPLWVTKFKVAYKAYDEWMVMKDIINLVEDMVGLFLTFVVFFFNCTLYIYDVHCRPIIMTIENVNSHKMQMTDLRLILS